MISTGAILVGAGSFAVSVALSAVLTPLVREWARRRDFVDHPSGPAGHKTHIVPTPFGGGIAKSGDWCGAVTGAFLVIGLKYGRVRADDAAAKDHTYALVQEFVKRFKAKHGSARCNDLLGCDIGTPEGQKTIEEKKLHQTLCEDLIRDAMGILDGLL